MPNNVGEKKINILLPHDSWMIINQCRKTNKWKFRRKKKKNSYQPLYVFAICIVLQHDLDKAF